MKRIILLINFLIFTFILQAQEKLNYQLKDESIEFTISQEEIYVEFAINDKTTIKRKTKNNFKELSRNSTILKMLLVMVCLSRTIFIFLEKIVAFLSKC